jgi:hypothetical protein
VKIITATTLGLMLGLLMAAPCISRTVEHWINASENISLAYKIVNYPAIFAVFEGAHLGIFHPSGLFGEFKFLPFAIIAQWSLLGALTGLAYRAKANTGTSV